MVYRRRAGQRLGQAPDDARAVPGGVYGLDDIDGLAGPRPGDGLTAEGEDRPAERGHSRIADRHRQRGDGPETAAVRGGQHLGVGLGAGVTAHDVAGAADGDRHRVGTRRGQCPRDGGGGAARLPPRAGRGELLDRGHRSLGPAAEDQLMTAQQRSRRIVQRPGQGADRARVSGRRVDGEDAAGRGAARRQPAQQKQPAARPGCCHLAAERGPESPRQQAGLDRRQAALRDHVPARRGAACPRACCPRAGRTQPAKMTPNVTATAASPAAARACRARRDSRGRACRRRLAAPAFASLLPPAACRGLSGLIHAIVTGAPVGNMKKFRETWAARDGPAGQDRPGGAR